MDQPNRRLEELPMAESKQSQRAGDNSQLLQANSITIVNGIDEKRVREICAETYEIARKNFTEDAYMCANERVLKFENALIPKMEAIENAYSAFADPSFQFLLTSAQKTAAATEREADYDMLAELLACRIAKGDSRKNRVGISRAVEIINQVDDDALCALTVAYAVGHFIPASGESTTGLQALNDLFESIIYLDLPNGADWIEHLDILDAVRISSFGSFKKTREYYCERLKGYSSAGIKINSEEYNKALQLLKDAKLSSNILHKNPNMSDYVLLPVINQDSIKDLNITSIIIDNGTPTHISRKITNEECSVLEAIWDLYTTDATINKTAEDTFISQWDSFPLLHKLHLWWDNLPILFNITHVGAVLAYTNAKRCDEKIPELPLTL